MRSPFDELCKRLIAAAFAPADRVERNAELASADAQKVDVLVEPRPAGDPVRARAGLLGRLLSEGPCHLEHFSVAPPTAALLETVRKVLTARHQGGRAVRLWSLCAGRPEGAIAALGFAPGAHDPAGVYRLPPGWAAGLVVLSELPAEPSTLLLRLLGRGPTFRAALAELVAQPRGAWEREVATPVLARLRFEAQATSLGGEAMSDEEAALMTTGEQLFQEWERRTLEQGRELGREQGRAEGLRAAVAALCEVFAIALDVERRAALERMNAADLEALCEALKQHRRWPAGPAR